METGKKFDSEKPRTDLLPTKPLLDIAAVLGYGAKKYDAHNWRSGIEQSRIYGAIMRHMFAYWDGEDIDPESGLPHLSHAATELMFLMEFAAKPEQYGHLDDRYRPDHTRVYIGVDMAAGHAIKPGVIIPVEDSPKSGMFTGAFTKKRKKETDAESPAPE